MNSKSSATYPQANKRGFYGWVVAATAFVTFGIAVGIPYYSLPFFYDYFQKAFHWDLKATTLGFPLAALLTIWVGPLLIPHFSPRKLIIAGTGFTAVALFGFAFMHGSLTVYYFFYFIYTVGYLFAGPIPHQILVSYWFKLKRGRAIGFVYVGVGLVGGIGPYLVRGLTARYGFQTALAVLGGLMFIAWPLAFFLLKDKPEELGQFPDGAAIPPPDVKVPAHTFAHLFRSRPFWLLLIGSICSIGSIGAIIVHMKFVFRDAGFTDQAALDGAWAKASVMILCSSILGRLIIGYLADVFSKKLVMTATYFVVVATILLLLWVSPERSYSLPLFALVFGFAMGADYMLIPLMAAEQFGVNTLARAMAVILPVNTIGQTWCPQAISGLREYFGNYAAPLWAVFGLAMLGALAIALLPSDTPAKTGRGLDEPILAGNPGNPLA
jgi:MFS family permease